jgi:two-component system chemotaxis response regulator CheY
MFPATTKILVVDDMLTMRKLVGKCLKDLGFLNITEAADGADALPMLEAAAVSQVPFQLIISDWNMPKMPGIELLKKIRANDQLKQTPFVFLTAENEAGQVMEAIKSGVNNYITKPFTPATLKDKLELVWKSAAAKKA